MVLESIISPFTAKKRPWEAFVTGALYASVALFLSFWVFRDFSSLIMVFLTTMVSVPLLYFTTQEEEEADLKLDNEFIILKEHGKALTFLILLFLGFVVAYTTWYVVLPNDMINSLFHSQAQTVLQVNNQISGNAANTDIFMRILLNNIRVLVFCVLFSLIYGMGAIFILTWNASVVATAMGNFIRTKLALLSETAGLAGAASYLHIISFGFLRYAFHGIPEMLGYFVGGLAGGILSMAIIRKDFTGEKRERVLFDTSELLLLALLILIIAAFMEVYITPRLFL